MLPGVRIGSLSQVDRSRTGTVAAWVMDGEQRLERRVASASFYNEKENVNSAFMQRYGIVCAIPANCTAVLTGLPAQKWEIRRHSSLPGR
jgi:hypothetical protein